MPITGFDTFPWPEAVSERQRSVVEAAAQKVLAVRAEFLERDGVSLSQTSSAKKSGTPTRHPSQIKSATLADLYDPLATPPALQKAHEELDRAVDKCYRPEPFTSERQRVEFLFALYEKLTAPLLPAAKSKRARRQPTQPNQTGSNQIKP